MPVSGSPVRCARSKDVELGGDDAQPVDVIGEQLRVQADPAHVLRLVHDERPAPADEGPQLRSATGSRGSPGRTMSSPDTLQGVRIVLVHVTTVAAVVFPTRQGP